MIRLGLVGVGRWGQRFIETVARRPTRDAAITCFARARDARDVQIPGATQAGDWREILDGHLCDGLLVVTPPDSHVEIVAHAAAAGMPALVEKPLALTADEVRRLARVLDQTPRVPVLVDHIHLYSPQFRKLKQLVAELAMPVEEIESVGCGVGPVRDYSSLLDYGPHDLSMCLDLLGLAEPRRLGPARMRKTPAGELYEFDLQIGGAVAHIKVGNGATAKHRLFRVSGGGHTLAYDDLRAFDEKLLLDGQPVAVSNRKPLDTVVDEFVDTVALYRRAGAVAGPVGRGGVELALAVAEIIDDVTGRLATPTA